MPNRIIKSGLYPFKLYHMLPKIAIFFLQKFIYFLVLLQFKLQKNNEGKAHYKALFGAISAFFKSAAAPGVRRAERGGLPLGTERRAQQNAIKKASRYGRLFFIALGDYFLLPRRIAAPASTASAGSREGTCAPVLGFCSSVGLVMVLPPMWRVWEY